MLDDQEPMAPPERQNLAPHDHKKCAGCQLDKPFAEFHKSKRRYDGLQVLILANKYGQGCTQVPSQGGVDTLRRVLLIHALTQYRWMSRTVAYVKMNLRARRLTASHAARSCTRIGAARGLRWRHAWHASSAAAASRRSPRASSTLTANAPMGCSASAKPARRSSTRSGAMGGGGVGASIHGLRSLI